MGEDSSEAREDVREIWREVPLPGVEGLLLLAAEKRSGPWRTSVGPRDVFMSAVRSASAFLGAIPRPGPTRRGLSMRPCQ